MDDSQLLLTPHKSSSQPRHSRSSGLENASAAQSWDLGPGRIPRPRPDSHASTPRPVSRSLTDVPLSTAVRHVRSSHSRRPDVTAPAPAHVPSLEPPIAEAECDGHAESGQGRTRTARYHGKYSSYDEMLANMDEHDPFQGEPPPPREGAPVRQREKSSVKSKPPKAAAKSHHSAAGGAGSRSQTAPHAVKHKPEGLTSGGHSAKDQAQEALNSTYSVKLDNPMYQGLDQPRRPESAKSNGTYTLGRTDSRIKLIPPVIEEPLAKHVTPASPAVTELKTMQGTTYHEECRVTEDDAEDANVNKCTVAEYIRKFIKQRECKKYVLDASKPGMCCCGRVQAWHEARDIHTTSSPSRKVWTKAKCTHAVPPTCFGTIKFKGFGQDACQNAPYVRLDHCTKPDVVWTLMSEHWNVPPPKLLISVTGGAKRFFMKNRLKASFKRGLVNAATTSGAWIITGGSNAGVMEFVGEAVNDCMMLTRGAAEQQIVALGIATWGIVDNRDSLESTSQEGRFPAEYNIEDLSAGDVRGRSPLDHNHTHFILVDNGTEGSFGAEIEFRAGFESYISQHMATGVTESQSVHVPVVQLVLEGGVNTVATAKEAIDNNTPVVVVLGSGRAADYIAYAYRATRGRAKDEESAIEPAGFLDELRTRAAYMFDWSREKDPASKQAKINKCAENVKHMVKKRNLITVFHLDDIDTTNEIDQALLFALLKANKSNAETQLKLALAWNRCDMARQEIFNMENRSQWQSMDLYSAMFTALVQDRVDFVQLFLDNGVDLKRFLTVYKLRELYDEVVHERYAGMSAELLRQLLQDEHQAWSCCKHKVWDDDMPELLNIVGKVINKLMRDHQNIYQDEKYIVKEGWTTTRDYSSTPGTHHHHHHPETSYNTTKVKEANRHGRNAVFVPDFDNPERELFLWAILFNRKALAVMFWKLGKDQIGGALTASAMLKALSVEAQREEEVDLSEQFSASAIEFEERAVGVLSECYQRDKLKAHDLLTRELVSWGETTLLTLADNAGLMEFMTHSCCQTKLNKIWNGKMALHTPLWKVLVGLVCPFVLPAIRFTSNEGVAMFPSQTEPKKPNQVAPHGDGSRNDEVVSRRGSREVVSRDDSREAGSPDFVRSPARRKLGKQELVARMFRVDLCGCCWSEDSISMANALKYFHTAPVVKFMYHTLAYLAFLSLFSFVLLIRLRPQADPGSPGLEEYIVWCWAATLLIEEIRQINAREPRSLRYKVQSYFGNAWNQFDCVVFLGLMVCIVLRFTLPANHFVWARRAYVCVLMLFFIRFMQTFFVSKNIGPKVIMIRRMVTDVMFFLMILAVFMVAYGVAAQAIRYPASPPTDWSVLLGVVYQPYFQMYGELFLEDLQGDVPGCSSNRSVWEVQGGDVDRCPEEDWLVMVLLAIYMMLTNVLLLNLLVAMFSYTFSKVQDNSEKVWRFYRYGLIHEYYDKPTLAPPLIILSLIWRLIKAVHRRHNNISKVNSDFHQVLSKADNSRLSTFEKTATETYERNANLYSREQIDAKVSSAGERIELVIADLEQIKEQVLSQPSDVASVEETQAPPPGTIAVLPPPPTASYDTKEDMMTLKSRMSDLEDKLVENQATMVRMLSLMQDFHRDVTSARARPEPSRHGDATADSRHGISVTDGGRHGSGIADDGRHGSGVVDDGRHGSGVADDGRRGSGVADDGHHGSRVTDPGRHGGYSDHHGADIMAWHPREDPVSYSREAYRYPTQGHQPQIEIQEFPPAPSQTPR